jgi:Flp pilus assembly pilin Flp
MTGRYYRGNSTKVVPMTPIRHFGYCPVGQSRYDPAPPNHKFGFAKEIPVELVKFLKALHCEESGQDLLEYALVLAAVLLAVVAGSSTLSNTISNALRTINTRIQSEVS